MQERNPVLGLAFNGALSIVEAPAVQARLVDAIRPGAQLILDFTDVVELDLSILQLLVAARIAAVQVDADLTLVPPRFNLEAEAARCGLSSSLLPRPAFTA